MEAVKLEPESKNKEAAENDHFIIDDDQKANWALRKIRHLKQKKRENCTLGTSSRTSDQILVTHV
jgi:hypothetical protein